MELRGLTRLEQKEIAEVLERFGLAEKEQNTYLALLRSGQTTLTPLARLLELPVTTVQSIVHRLRQQGLVRVTMRRSRHLFEASDPITLRRTLEQQIEQAANIIPLLQKIRRDAKASPKVRIYVRERINDIFRESLKAKSKLVYEIVAARELQEVIGERLHYTRLRVKHGIRLKSLRVEAREIKRYTHESHVRELREAKFLPRELTFPCSIFFWDDTIAFITPASEGLAWIVESPAVRQTTQQIFDLLWSVSRPMVTAEETSVAVKK